MALIVHNPKLLDELKAESRFQDGVRGSAEELKSAVQQIARGFAHTGSYGDSIDVVRLGENTYVRTTDFAGHLIEWGSANNPVYAPLRRGARAAGFRLTET